MKKMATLVLVFLVAVSLSACTNEKGEQNEKNEQKNQNSDQQLNRQSVSDLMKGNKSVKCVFDVSDDKQIGDVTIYVGKGKGRTEYNIKMNGQTMGGYSISDDEWTYTWRDGEKTGMKMNLKEMAESGEGMDNEGFNDQSFDLDEEHNLNCQDWKYDSSKFMPPSDIEFQDFSKTLKQMNELSKNMESGEMNLCASCDYIPDAEEKADCLQQLGCE